MWGKLWKFSFISLFFFSSLFGVAVIESVAIQITNMSRSTAVPTRLHVRPAKAEISLRIRAV